MMTSSKGLRQIQIFGHDDTTLLALVSNLAWHQSHALLLLLLMLQDTSLTAVHVKLLLIQLHSIGVHLNVSQIIFLHLGLQRRESTWATKSGNTLLAMD